MNKKIFISILIISFLSASKIYSAKITVADIKSKAQTWQQKHSNTLTDQEKSYIAQALYYLVKGFEILLKPQLNNADQQTLKSLKDTIVKIKQNIQSSPAASKALDDFKADFGQTVQALSSGKNKQEVHDHMLNSFNQLNLHYEQLIKGLSNKTISIGPDKGKSLPGSLGDSKDIEGQINIKLNIKK